VCHLSVILSEPAAAGESKDPYTCENHDRLPFRATCALPYNEVFAHRNIHSLVRGIDGHN